MIAAVIDKFGEPNVFKLCELPIPHPKPTQILINITAGSINPIDWKHRQGKHKYILGSPFPIILGYDVSGTIVECGSEITAFKVGDKVFGVLNNKYGGGLAEFALCTEKCVALAPKSISLIEASGLPMAGLTAVQALKNKANLHENQTILIVGAAGGVGHLAVQIAKILNAKVHAVASGKHTEFMNKLQPDSFTDYTKTNILECTERFDVIFDVAGIYTYLKCKQLLKPGGLYLTTLPRPKLIFHKLIAFLKGHNIRTLLMKHNSEELSLLANWIDNGMLKLNIEKQFLLSEVAKAHAFCEDYHNQGKIIVKIESI